MSSGEVGDTSFEVGEPCFAKVKGYPMWPAEVTNLTGSKFEVFFFGTHEVAKVGPKEILKATPANFEKFSQSSHVNRKFYKEGLQEMTEFTNKSGSSAKRVSFPVDETKPSTDSPPRTAKKLKLETPSKVPMMTTKEPKQVKVAKSPKRKSARESVPNESGEVIIKSPVKSTEKVAITSPRRVVSKPVRFKEGDECSSSVDPSAPSTSLPRKSPNKRRMETPSESSTNISKSSIDDNVKISINLNLEMSADTFVKVAKQLPQLLNMAGVNSKNQ